MATTSSIEGLDLTKWRKKFIPEMVRDSGFEPYMGASEMDIIHVVNDLQTDGYTIRVPLLKALKSDGVTGNQRLGGNEESMDQYYQDITWDFHRNAIEVSKKEQHKSALDLFAARQPLLRDWASERIKYQCIDTFHQLGNTKYTLASEAQKDAWTAANSDRVLFGAALSNNSSNDHSASLANIDATNDKLTPELATLAKRLARKARPRIRPFKTGTQGREFFVMFCNPLAFRDLKNNNTMQQANREARDRDHNKNPIFQDGDLIYDGVIFREIVEFYSPRDPAQSVNTETTLVGVGASSIDVAPNFLCGAQSIGMVNKQAATPISKKEDDYGFFDGVGIEMAHGFEKLTWNNGSDARQDVGMFTVYTSAVADA